MQTHITTTPFGRGVMKLDQIATQIAAKAVADGAEVNKWEAFKHIREAKERLGATDRALAILNALLSFHRDSHLSADGTLVVWPSNEQLSARANGMPPSTLRRHLAVLVSCGLVIRRDSPNGKRFARKGRGGEVEQAYGFDLTPILARVEEFECLAEAARMEKKSLRIARERLTLLRRDIVKMIETGIEEGVPGNWGRQQLRYQSIMLGLPRTASREIIEQICAELQTMSEEIRGALESFVKSTNPSANESHFERHIQNSNPDTIIESEYGSGKKEEAGSSGAEADNVRSLPKRNLPLSMVVNACPDIVDLAGGREIRYWRELLAVAESGRVALGISPSAWHEACDVMGDQQAAITMAAIYQRTDEISSAGGYLRTLTDKAREGKFSTWPMVMALARARLENSRKTDVGPTAERQDETPRMQVSDALLRSLNRK